MTNTFEAATHTYTIGGIVVPSNTEILEDVGFRESFFDKEWYADKGTKIHLACHFHNKGTLFWDTVDPLIFGYVEAYLKFKRECNVEVKASELIVYNETLMYGTTVDSIDNLDFMGKRIEAIVELKSGQAQTSDAIQTAGQKLALDSSFNEYAGINRRFILYLKQNGTYKLVECTDYEDYKDFEAACRVYHRKRRT